MTAKPSRKETPIIRGRFLVFVSAVPILFPIGVIDCSAPSEKSPIPATIIIAPTRNARSRSVLIGRTQRQRSATMTIIGITETADSLSFSASAVLVLSSVILLAFEKNFIRFHLYTCSGRAAPRPVNAIIIS